MSSFSVCYCRQKLPVNMHCPLVMLVRRMLNWRDKKVIKVTCSQQDKRELRLLSSNRPILLMFLFMQLEFFAVIKEGFTTVDYTYDINFKRWTVFRGGSRGRVQGVRTPPEMTCGFLIQLVFCKKKSGLLVLKQSKRRVHPLLKQILDPPLVFCYSDSEYMLLYLIKGIF